MKINAKYMKQYVIKHAKNSFENVKLVTCYKYQEKYTTLCK